MEIILSPRDQKIFFYRILGYTCKSIAHEFGISKSRVQQICFRGMRMQQWRYFDLRETPFGDHDPYLNDSWNIRTLIEERERRLAALIALPAPNLSEMHP